MKIDGTDKTVGEVADAIRAGIAALPPKMAAMAVREIRRQCNRDTHLDVDVRVGEFELRIKRNDAAKIDWANRYAGGYAEGFSRASVDMLGGKVELRELPGQTRPEAISDDLLYEIMDDGSPRFVAPHEIIDLTKSTGRFGTIEWAAIERVFGRALARGPDGLPVGLDERQHRTLRSMARIKHEIIDNPDFTRAQKAKAFRRAERQLREQNTGALRAQLDEIGGNMARIAANKDVLIELCQWMDRGDPRLERPDGSQHASLADAWERREVMFPMLDGGEVIVPPGLMGALHAGGHIFVVHHDWAAAMRAATFDSGEGPHEIRLPYDHCCFEFQVSGKRVCAIFQQDEIGTLCLPFIRTRAGWVLLCPYKVTDAWTIAPSAEFFAHESREVVDQAAYLRLIAENVRAVCITLEAGVTEAEVVRVPEKLNRARQKNGKRPMLDHHVVSLARRERAEPLPRGDLDPDREVVRRRMHFRRGHWRRYADHRTWIKWMLCGNPDLGFVDKEYRL